MITGVDFGTVTFVWDSQNECKWVSGSGKSMWAKEGHAKLALRNHYENYIAITHYPTFESWLKTGFDLVTFDVKT